MILTYLYLIGIVLVFSTLCLELPVMVIKALAIAPILRIWIVIAILLIFSFVTSWLWPVFLLYYFYNKVFNFFEKKGEEI